MNATTPIEIPEFLFLFRHAPTFGSPHYIRNFKLDTALRFLGDELLSLTAIDLPCYIYYMHHRHDAPSVSGSPSRSGRG
jgi:hypothetical protein